METFLFSGIIPIIGRMIDGVYFHDQSFIRFYKDGSFISCLIKVDNPNEATLRQIMEWFNNDHDLVSHGQYSMKGKSIEFKKTTPFGERLIDYKGTYRNNQINFQTLNHNNGRRSNPTYRKVQLKYIPKGR